MALTEAEARTIIADDDRIDLLVEKAREMGLYLKNDASATQLRRFFGEVRRIDMAWSDDAESGKNASRRLLLLVPRLRYMAAKRPDLRDVEPAIGLLIRQVQGDRSRFTRFAEFMEAVVAYAKKDTGGND